MRVGGVIVIGTENAISVQLRFIYFALLPLEKGIFNLQPAMD